MTDNNAILKRCKEIIGEGNAILAKEMIMLIPKVNTSIESIYYFCYLPSEFLFSNNI